MNAALSIDDYVGESPGRVLAEGAAALEKVETHARQQRNRFEELYTAAQRASYEAILVVAADLLVKEREYAETFVPLIKRAEDRVDNMLRSTRSHTAEQKSYMRINDQYAKALAAWLGVFRDARIRLHLLASDKIREAGVADVEITSDADLEEYFRSVTRQ
jgi:hypothetical protein